jgi:hypothetical protein
MTTKITEDQWLRDGRLVYSIRSIGFRKGKEQFTNRFAASVQAQGCSEEEAEAVAALMHAAPDLFKELTHLVRLLEPLEKEGSLDVPGLATLNGARAALRKARFPMPSTGASA